MTDSPITTINLVPTSVLAMRARRRCTLRWGGAVVATLCLVGLPGVYIGGNAALSDPAINAQIEQVNHQLAVNEKMIPVLGSRLGALQSKLEVLELVENRIDWRMVFADIVRASEDDIRFTGISANGGGVEGLEAIGIRIDGLATTQTAARSFVVSLESLGMFDRVELTRTARREVSDIEVIEFQIVASVPSKAQASGATP